MAIDLAALKAELTAGHPGTGAYNADDALAANEINAVNRDAPADAMALLNYCILNDHRGESLYGRIASVAEAKPGDNVPLDDADANIVMTLKMTAAAKAFMRFMEPDVQATEAPTSTGWDSILNALAGGPTNAQTMGPAHKTAIQALSNNRQSRATELGFGGVKPVDVRAARALP